MHHEKFDLISDLMAIFKGCFFVILIRTLKGANKPCPLFNSTLAVAMQMTGETLKLMYSEVLQSRDILHNP